MAQVKLYDTTLRDGTQGEGVNLSVADKLKIARRLDEFGIHYIEGGWPGSNFKDVEFFQRVREVPLRTAKIAAFGSTHRAGIDAAEDTNLRLLVESAAPVITIFGKTWDFHVKTALRVPLDVNLAMIEHSVAFLKAAGREVIYDAEHFFDGWKGDESYALATVEAAVRGGADIVVLCDTNGGSLPHEIAAAIRKLKQAVKCKLGIHTHNDGGVGAANALEAVRSGVRHVQGTINGYGERCGNVDLTTVLPNLQLKMGYECVPRESLAHLRQLSLYVSELANQLHRDEQPFVGAQAFAHKGGIHVDAVMKHPETYEHVHPEDVGNDRRVLVSELSGSSNVRYTAERFGIKLRKGSDEVKRILRTIKHLESEGWEFEGAEASFELLVRRELGLLAPLFDLKKLETTVEKLSTDTEPGAECVLKISIRDKDELVVAEGDGPVHALDGALRMALLPHYPVASEIKLTDYKVRVVNVRAGTAAKVRVLVESSCDGRTWNTVGVSTNIIDASWQALVDGYAWGLLHIDELHLEPTK